MTLKDYQLLTSRTNTDLGSKAINAAHVTLGIVGEWEEFIDECFIGQNREKVCLEGGDVCWYISELANIFNIELDWMYGEQSFETLQAMTAESIKKFLAYQKPINEESLKFNLIGMIGVIKYRLNEFSIPLEDCLTMNIAKLQKRFPEKFSAELAIAKGDEQ
jgi:NTP pyrophosphatase (non-canonical NTP hydrolase)